MAPHQNLSVPWRTFYISWETSPLEHIIATWKIALSLTSVRTRLIYLRLIFPQAYFLMKSYFLYEFCETPSMFGILPYKEKQSVTTELKKQG